MTTTDQLSLKSKALFRIISTLTLKEQVEIIANLIIECAIQHIDTPHVEVSAENVFGILMRDRASKGETLSNALLYQGLTMLDWLNKNKI